MSTDARILVLSAGLSTPSSTRMLADGLARETRQALAHHGVTAHVDTVELREVAHDVVDMLITRFPSPPPPPGRPPPGRIPRGLRPVYTGCPA